MFDVPAAMSCTVRGKRRLSGGLGVRHITLLLLGCNESHNLSHPVEGVGRYREGKNLGKGLSVFHAVNVPRKNENPRGVGTPVPAGHMTLLLSIDSRRTAEEQVVAPCPGHF